MKRLLIGGIAVGIAAAAAVGYLQFGPVDNAPELSLVSNNQDGPRLRAIGLTADQRLVTFKVTDPDETRAIGKVTGLSGDARLVGIDYRVQDGKLYGVGVAGGVYTLSASDAKATKVGQLTVALSGASFGVDFNPAADRLRIVSDTGQNLRHNVNPGGTTIADTPLTYPPATTTVTGVTAVAYTNNDLDANTATTLFAVDTMLDQVSVQAPANAGLLSPAGKLTVDAAGDAGFDIYNGRSVDAAGFLTLTVGGRSALYTVSLVTGRAEKVDAFPRKLAVVDLALPLNQ